MSLQTDKINIFIAETDWVTIFVFSELKERAKEKKRDFHLFSQEFK